MGKVVPTRRVSRLSTQVLLLVIAILMLTVGAGFAVSFVQARHNLDESAGERSLEIARAVAGTTPIVDAFHDPDPAAVIDPIVERIRASTGAAFIVVANRQGVRYSHPNPAKIGTSLMDDPGEDPTPVLAGGTYLGVQSGSLGRSMRAKVPLRDASGHVIGLVSVGVLESEVSSELSSALPVTLIPPALGLALGVIGALLLGHRVKRQTFGLEPGEIATLLEQREAMLHGIREGAITVDAAGHLTLLNDEAENLLGLDRSSLGRPLADVLPEGRVRDVLTGRVEGRDEMILVGDRVLVVNRMPVELHSRPIGAVVTLRDRTELDALVRELDDTRTLADGLRAQEHEFANRLHVIGGLIELKRYDDVVRFVNATTSLHQELAAAVFEPVGDPILAALLLGKAALASERGIALQVSAGDLPEGLDTTGLVTVLGNLIDNALDSAAATGTAGRVEVTLGTEGDALVMRVHDSGAGVDPALTDEIFTHGFTTKVARDGGRRRGIGLALVSQEVRRRGGRITVENADGALFTVTLPLPADQRAAQPAALGATS